MTTNGMKIIAGKTILLNTASNCTFLASKLDEKTQLKQGNVEHIEIAGELSIKVDVREETNLPEGSDEGFVKDLQIVINSYSKENGSNTPDYILAQYLKGCLDNFNKIVMLRSDWYGNVDRIGCEQIEL